MAAATTQVRGPILPKKQLISNSVFGMLILVFSEAMLFSAFISTFFIVKAANPGAWAPPGDIRLPVSATLANTFILFVSGFSLFMAGRVFAKPETRSRAGGYLLRAMLLGALFVGFQSYEWVKLIAYGMTMTSGPFGATFFLLIGCHGLHAAAAVLAMPFFYMRFRKGTLKAESIAGLQVFWFFIVGMWPILFWLVYL